MRYSFMHERYQCKNRQERWKLWILTVTFFNMDFLVIVL